MPAKTKADLERELKKAKQLLHNIIICFERYREYDYNTLRMQNTNIENLDEALDHTREFLN